MYLATAIKAAFLAYSSSSLAAPHAAPQESTPAPTPTPDLGTYYCPSEDRMHYTPPLLASTGLTFRILCNTDWPAGTRAYSGRRTVKDVKSIIATSVRSCLRACADERERGGANGLGCEAVSYSANITHVVGRVGKKGNCVLKSERGRESVGDGEGLALLEGAYLIEVEEEKEGEKKEEEKQ